MRVDLFYLFYLKSKSGATNKHEMNSLKKGTSCGNPERGSPPVRLPVVEKTRTVEVSAGMLPDADPLGVQSTT